MQRLHTERRGSALAAVLVAASAAPAALAAPQSPPIDPFDLNGDGVIDPYDLDLLVLNVGRHDGVLPGDVDGDGDVDRADFARVLPVFRWHFDLDELELAQKLVGVRFPDEEEVPKHATTVAHLTNYSNPGPDHLTLISMTWDDPNHPDDPHQSNLSSHGPIPNHVWSISKTWHPGKHDGLSSWWSPDDAWPPGHKDENSQTWKPNHMASISMRWHNPPHHWSSTSEEHPIPTHTTSLSSSWPPNHEYSLSLGWTPHLSHSSKFQTHSGLVSVYWPGNHVKSYSDKGVYPPSPPDPETHDSDLSFNVGWPWPNWPFGHQYEFSGTWPENHAANVSVYFPPNHVYQITAQWPNPFLWPPNHTVPMTNGWIEPGTPPGHDSWFSTIHNTWWSTVAPPTHTIVTSLSAIPLPKGGAPKK